MSAMTFDEAVRKRRAVRHFRPGPVPDDKIRAVLADAQLAPSNCNTQPWNVHIVSGATRNALSKALCEAFAAGRFSMDFSFDQKVFHDQYAARSTSQATVYLDAVGVQREDVAGRREVSQRNLTFYNAPHVALLFMPSFGDNVRVAADVGMYGQTFLLSLVAHGLGGVPQTMLGMFADAVREVLSLGRDNRLLFGISFGYPDMENAANTFRIARAPIEDCVTFHR